LTVSAPRVSGSSWPRALGAYSREVGAWQPSAPPERATADVGLFQTAAVYIDPAERMPEAVGTQNITNKRHGFRDSHFRGFGCLDPPSFWSQSWNGKGCDFPVLSLLGLARFRAVEARINAPHSGFASSFAASDNWKESGSNRLPAILT